MRIRAKHWRNAILIREVIKSFVWHEKTYYVINLIHDDGALDVVDEDSWIEIPELPEGAQDEKSST